MSGKTSRGKRPDSIASIRTPGTGTRLAPIYPRVILIQSDSDVYPGSLTLNHIGKVERGEAQPTLEALLSIADALKSNLSNLFFYLDRPMTKDETKAKIWELLGQL